MKKKFIFSGLALAMFALGFIASDEPEKDDTPSGGAPSETPSTPETPALEENFFTVENGVFVNAPFPAATTDEELEGVSMSEYVMSGNMNFITVTTEQEVETFYLAVEGQEGYIEYTPIESSETRGTLHVYIIPVMISIHLDVDFILWLAAKLLHGHITPPCHHHLGHLQTREGDVEVKLAFSNEKDIDIHLYTPSGIHIYYGNSSGGYYEGSVNGVNGIYEFGLDIDSNANCSIDGINKENIYIPAQFVEDGIYTVEVDLYKNCNPSIATQWSISTTYKGKLVTPLTGANPASGEFKIGAPSSGNSNHVAVMTFEIKNSNAQHPRSVKGGVMSHDEFWNKIPENQKDKIEFSLDD